MALSPSEINLGNIFDIIGSFALSCYRLVVLTQLDPVAMTATALFRAY